MIPDKLPRDLPSFLARFGTDAQCRAYLFARRWPGLARWFLAIWLVTSSRGGISALELQMGFASYQTAPAPSC